MLQACHFNAIVQHIFKSEQKHHIMPTVTFGDCLSNYWFVWSINGLGSIFGLAINMAISFFVVKYFHTSSPSLPKKPKSQFSQYRTTSPVSDMPGGSWTNNSMMGNAFDMSRV